MFPMIFAMGLEIGYAYTSFKWENNAKRNAGVTVAVINLRRERSGPKFIYSDGMQIKANNINGYLADAPNLWTKRQLRARSAELPVMALGSVARDEGALLLDGVELEQLLHAAPQAQKYVKRFLGSAEFIMIESATASGSRKQTGQKLQQSPKLLADLRGFASFVPPAAPQARRPLHNSLIDFGILHTSQRTPSSCLASPQFGAHTCRWAILAPRLSSQTPLTPSTTPIHGFSPC